MKTNEFSACDVLIESTVERRDRSLHGPLPSPDEGRKLLRAFMAITDPALRSAVIDIVQNLSRGRPEELAETLRRRSFLS